MAVVFTILFNDALTQANATPYHAMFRAVNEETKTTLLNDANFDTVGIYKNFGGTVDKEGRTSIVYMDPAAMEVLGYTLSSGTYPVIVLYSSWYDNFFTDNHSAFRYGLACL